MKTRSSFLKEEFKFYKEVYNNDYIFYLETMFDFVKNCTICNKPYWHNCKRRCNCKIKGEKKKNNIYLYEPKRQ